MPLLCFVLDTSQSMNQKTVQGQRLIDHAKTAIENFINKVRDKKKHMEKNQIEFISIEKKIEHKFTHCVFAIRYTPYFMTERL